jgi:ankyrin repeat protein
MVCSKKYKKNANKVRFDPKSDLLYLCHYADEKRNGIELVKQCLEAIKIIEGELNVNNIYSPQQWLSPLHIACSHGNVEIAKLLLLEANAAVNIEDKEGWTPLHCAAAEGHIEVIKLLAKCQGSIFDKDKTRSDIYYVFDGPIDLEPVNNDDESAEDVALESKKDEIIHLLTGIHHIE